MQTETQLAVRGGSQFDQSEVQLVLFTLASETYGVSVLAVEEIMRYQTVTAVPRAPEFVKGVIDLRGRVIPIVDLRERLGLPAPEATNETRIVVLEAAGNTVGLIVDSVDEVRTLPTGDIQPPSAAITSTDSEFLIGVGRLPDNRGGQQLVILLDVDRVLTVQQQAALATTEAAA